MLSTVIDKLTDLTEVVENTEEISKLKLCTGGGDVERGGLRLEVKGSGIWTCV